MDLITMLITLSAAAGVTFRLLLDRTNWGRSKRAVIYIVIALALISTGVYS